MGKHINTKIDCHKCDKPFMTTRLKIIGESFSCPKCKVKYIADIDDDASWFPVVVKDE